MTNLTGDEDKITRRVSMIAGEPDEDLLDDSISTAYHLVMMGLRKAGITLDRLGDSDIELLEEALNYYATAEVLQVVYNSTASDGGPHIEYYMNRGDSLVATVIERVAIEEDLNEGCPVAHSREEFYFNSRYNLLRR